MNRDSGADIGAVVNKGDLRLIIYTPILLHCLSAQSGGIPRLEKFANTQPQIYVTDSIN